MHDNSTARHAMPDSTDGLTDGVMVFRQGLMWRWSARRHTWVQEIAA